MLHKNSKDKKTQLQMISIEELVPQNHLVRKIEKALDFDFIYELVEDKYCLDNGRPSIDPVVLFKILIIQYIFGIKSMRQTIKEIEVNVAYRWFIGYDFYDKIPHFSTVGKNYERRFKNTEIFEQIFTHILNQAIKIGLVDEKIQFVDSTHVKANANRHKAKKQIVVKKAKAYKTQLEKEIAEDRKEHDKNPIKPPKDEGPEEKEELKSTTDPESGLFHKGEHKEVFAYCVQTSCDKNGWITECEVYPGNEHDSTTFIDFYENKLKRQKIEKLVMDAGYKTPAILKMLIDDGIQPVIPYTSPKGTRDKGQYYPKDYVYDEYYDCYICPEEKILKYSTTARDGYRIYKSDKKICANCPNLERCTKSKNKQKIIARHIWKNYVEAAEEYRYTTQAKKEYKLRKETVERDFAQAKEIHGMRYTNMRGKKKMRAKAYLTFACMNLKKLANYMYRNGLTKDHFKDFLLKFLKKFNYQKKFAEICG